ncbi:MAG: SDR family oxidoreductase [Thermoguttaceae bacterium]|nr:SDR family oxidoreductase [Thermoguttaceae bacterium]MDW8037493.1 SDR family oxidoreductase [Thermoguttaceae bacterium]
MAKEHPRRIVITGVSRGLGRAMVEGFIDRGHVVAGCARSAEAIDELRRRFGPPHRFDVVDVAKEPEVARWAKAVLADSPVVDLLINNAALINRNAPLWQVPPEEFEAVIDVNIKGVYYVLRHFLPSMVARGQGVIVNISSGWGRSTSPEVAPYCATKWAIEGLTQALAQELPPGMAAVPLNPGIIHTQMLESCFGPEAASYPSPQQWAEKAIPLLLRLGPKHNGRPMSVGVGE